MKNRKQKNRGITLVALIITVIVMLILAGVAIQLTIGENGIFKKSEEGAQVYKNATNNEASSLNDIDTKTGELINQYHSQNMQDGTPGKPNEAGIYTQNATINGGKEEAFNPMIPKGFKPVDIEDAIWGDGTNPPTRGGSKKGISNRR